MSRIRRSLACGLALAAVLDPARAAADPERYLLALFHFNLQYVPGGLHGFPDGTGSGGPDYDLTNDEVEDRIITESFEPLLDTCLDHPEIAIDIELQGYFLDVLAARHPGVIGKLKTLTANGQVELVSIHYSDQLFLAFPRVDLERSFALDEAAFARAGLPRAEVSFAQEGQFGEGLLDFLAAHGFRGALMPKNLLHYLHRGLPFAARYDAGSGLPTVALAGEGGADPSGAVAVDWSFFDDGELWASDRLSPYFGKRYAFNPAERDAFVARIQSAIAAGFTPATVSRYLDRLEALAVPRPPLPPILDGTWQPGSTDTMHKWLGGSGLFDAFGPGEKDNVVRTRNARGHAALVAAEAALSSMDGGQRADGQKRIDTGWRELALGEVTDATGINPYRTEVEYGIAHSDAAIAWAESALGLLWPKLSGPVEIDSGTGSVGPAPAAGARKAVAPPLDVAVTAPGRTIVATWTEPAAGGPAQLDVAIGAASAGQRIIELDIPLATDVIGYSPGLVEDRFVEYPLAAFDFENITLPLANGLIEVAPGRFLVKHLQTVHLGAVVDRAALQLRFRDETAIPDAQVMSFTLVDGSADDALAVADRLNVHPRYRVELPAKKGGCGCGAGEGEAAVFSSAFLALAFRRRTRFGTAASGSRLH